MGTFQLNKKSQTIVIFDPTNSRRNQIYAILDNLGFRQVVHYRDAADILALLASDPPAWIFTPLLADQEITGFHILREGLAAQTPCQVSMFFEPGEECYVPLAFSFGIISCHMTSIKNNFLKDEISQVVKAINRYGNDTLVAAAYLKNHLQKNKSYAKQVELCEKMVSLFPKMAEVYLWLAEAYFLCQMTRDATYTLTLCDKLEDYDQQAVDRLLKQYLPRPLDASDRRPPIHGCVIIDSDTSSCFQTRKILSLLKAENVMWFNNSEDALHYLNQSRNVELLVTEWKQPAVNGASVIQRISELGLDRLAIVITSSQVKQEDIPLLKEFSVSAVITKPLQEKEGLTTIAKAVMQNRFPSNIAELMRKANQFRHSQNGAALAEVTEQIALHPQATKSLISQTRSCLALLHGEMEEAKSFAREALELGGDPMVLHDTLGQIAFQQGQWTEAEQELQICQKVANRSIHRLCTLAEIKAKQEDQEGAETLLKQALQFDTNSIEVRESALGLIKGSMEYEQIENMIGDAESAKGLISHWNYKAVEHIRRYEFDLAIRTYKKALLAIPKGESNNRSFLRYNIALAYARKRQFKHCRAYLETLICEEQSPVLEKSKSLHKKVMKFLESGVEVELNQEELHRPQNIQEVNFHDLETRLNIHVQSGDHCLYRIFYFQGQLPDEHQNLFSAGGQQAS